MKRTDAYIVVTIIAGLALIIAIPAWAQLPRPDVIWARSTTATLTLDGQLTEPAWAQAESMIVRFGRNAGDPGSGYKIESGVVPRDSTYAVLKFLAKGNQLWFAAVVRDSSVGGSREFNRFDGLLMALKDHDAAAFPKPPSEYFYSWWYPELTDPQPPGQLPRFIGRWAPPPPPPPGPVPPRDSTQIANWDARTVVQGTSNNDAVIDQGYTVEMRFNLTDMGYNITTPAGEAIEWNISVYDCDWFWPFNGAKFSSNRVWWQSPWGNAAWYNEVRVWARSTVTTSSGPVPLIGPDLTVNAVAGTAPTINGTLTEAIWTNPGVYSFNIKWNDAALRASYPGTGPWRSGQFQPEVYGGTADVLDPGDATVKMFTQGSRLYMGFDVRDQIVQYLADINRWDGFIVTLNDRTLRDPQDHELQGRRLSFQVNQSGGATAQDYLSTLIAAGKAQVAIALKPGTTVDTLGLTPDTGYTGELYVDLTGIGYTPGLSDGKLFIGVNLLDGDSFFNPVSASYGTRTWWFRQYEGECCPAWAFMSGLATDVASNPFTVPAYGSSYAFANPSARPVIHYTLPEANRVLLEVFDVTGRRVEARSFGVQNAGAYDYPFDGAGRAIGLYYYRLLLEDPATGEARPTLEGRMVVLR